MLKYKSKFFNNKRVLVTGHKGFLGSWLTKLLLGCGAKVVGIDISDSGTSQIIKGNRSVLKSIRGDIADFNLVKKTIDSYKPQVIFHLAAQAIVGEALKNPLRTFKSNIEGTWNILEASRGKKFIEAIVVASSDKAYGSHKKLPYREDMPLQGRFPYDVSKSCADLLACSYFKTYNVPVCVTRCGNIFGPGDLHFSRLVPDAIRSILKNRQFVVRSDGKFTRDYIYVVDVAYGYMLLAEKIKKLKLNGQSFNFSNEKPFTVLEFFREMVKISGDYNLKPRILNKAKYEIKHQYLCSEKAKKVLGWKPQHTLEEALRNTFKWYRDFIK